MGKVGYNGVGDRVGLNKILKDVKLSNKGVGYDMENKDNWCVMVNDVKDSNDIVIDPINRIFIDVLTHHFSFLSPQSNLPLGITTVYFVQFYNNKFKFLFISLLTLL